MRENLVMTSAYVCPCRLAGRYYLGAKYTAREGRGNPRHAACVCLGETLASLPRGSQLSFFSKDLEFRLIDLPQENLWL